MERKEGMKKRTGLELRQNGKQKGKNLTFVRVERKKNSNKKKRSKPNESQGWQRKVRHKEERQNRQVPVCTLKKNRKA